MTAIRIIVNTAKSAGKPLPKGTVIKHPEAWRHCMPGFRNSPPVAEPADAETKALVEKKLAAREKRATVVLKNLQTSIDKLAAKLGLEDGQFKKNKAGKVLKATEAEQAMIDTAAAYGIHPTPAG